MGTLKACLAVVNDFTVEDYDALEAKAKDYAGGKPLANSHFIKAAQDTIATLKQDAKTIEAGMEPEVKVEAAEPPAQPPAPPAVENKDVQANAEQTVSPEEVKTAANRRLDRLRKRKTALDISDEADIELAIERGDFAEANKLMADIERAMRDNRYRTVDAQDPPSNPISREALEKIVKTVSRFLAGRFKVTILDDVAEFDPTQKPGTRAGVLTSKGNIILFRSGIADGPAGMKTVFHELLHRGLRVLYTPQEYQQLMLWLYDNAPQMRATANKWLAAAKPADLDGLTESEQKVLAIDETLAQVAEETKPTLLRQLGNWLALLASKLGLNDLARSIRTMKMTELESFVSDALRAATRPDLDVQFSTGDVARPGTTKFRRWFGDSKVVNADGKPLVVYHGTTADVTKFDLSYFGKSDDGLAGKGFYFSISGDVASGYSTSELGLYRDGKYPNVLPVYLKAENPLVWDYFSEKGKRLQKLREDLGADGFRDWLKQQGYDSVNLIIDGNGDDRVQWMVLDPTQIKSATGNSGEFDPTNPDIRYRTVREAVEGMGDNLRYDKLGMARRGVLSSSFLRDLGSRFGEKIKGVKEYVQATFDMSATAADIQEEATKVQDALTALPTAQRTELVEFMADATAANVVIEEKGGRNNDHLTDKTEAEALQAKFARMSDKQKAAYRLARESLAKLWKKRGELLTRTADDIYNPLIAEAKRAGNEQQTATLERERRAYIEDINARLNELKGDYFPMMRFGEYAVVRKSAAYEALQKEADTAYDELNALLDKYEAKTPDERKAIKEANKRLKTLGADLIGEFTPEQDAEIKAARKKYNDAQAKLEGMKSSEADYYMAQFESEAEARRHAKELGGKVLLKQEMHRELNPINRSMLNRLGESLETTMRARGGVTALRDAKQAMYQVFLSSLPERSALKRQAKRKNVAGFNRDMERAIISSMLRDSFYLSRMEHSDRINEALMTARKDAEAQGDVALQEVGEELAKRLASSMRYVDTPVQDAVAGLTYAWQLGVSPGYLLTNMTQPFTVSMPMMWARHGAKSVAAYGRAFADTAKAVSKSLQASLRGEVDFENSGLPKDEVAMLNAMLRNRLLNVTLVQDLARTADGKPVSRFSSFLAKPSHFVEVANRMSTALAAYRLEKPKTGQEAAVKYAQRVLADTHFDYSAENAPYWMKPGVVPMNKILFQFKKYQVGMISLFAKTAAAMANGDKVAKAEAKKQMLGMLATHLAIGGVLALPAMGTLTTLAGLIGRAFGDDEEPFDAEVALRNYFYDEFGPELGTVLAKGIPTLFGADLSQKAGLGDLLTPLPTLRDDKQGRDFYLELLAASAGPFLGGIVPRMFEAVNNLAQGNFLKAVEGMVPKWVADPVRAARFGEEGITTKQGTVALDREQISAWDLVLQATGVPAANITESYEARAAIENKKAKLTKTAAQYKKDWLEAKADGDNAKAEELWQEIRTKVNPARTRNGLEPITKSELLRFQQQRKKTEGKYAEFGGNANPKLAQVGRFALQ